MRMHLRNSFWITATSLLLLTYKADAQQGQSIDIISSYKPFLLSTVKINLSGSNLTDSLPRPTLRYNIPAQNLFYSYAPAPIRPLALEQDTTLMLGVRHFIKAGFGNYTTPYLDAGFSFGNGKKSLVNVYGDYLSSKGSIRYQDYTLANVKVTGSYFTPSNELYGLAAVNWYNINLYGYDHSQYDPVKDSIARYYRTLRVKAGFRNKVTTNGGFDYDPTIEYNNFTGHGNINPVENNILIQVPLSKKLSDDFFLKVTGSADLTHYTADSSTTVKADFNNNIVKVTPELIIEKESYLAHIGITPAWDNQRAAVLPNVYGEVHFNKQKFIIQAGITGDYIKNSFSNLIQLNPYIQPLTQNLNTKAIEFYGGLQYALTNHFSFGGKASYISYNNLQLFLNDTLDNNGRTFYLRTEPKAGNFRIHADASYLNGEKLNITAGLTLNQYSGLKNNERPWGLLPVEFNTAIRWEAFQHVIFKGNLYAFQGAAFLLKNNVIKTTGGGGTDLSIGAEVGISRHWSAWLDLNNLLNDRYQRWNNYEVYGVQVLGGLLFKF